MNLRSERLTVVARLKAAQVTQAISTILGEIILISSRNFLQSLLSSYYLNGEENIDQASIQEFHLVLESIDNAVAGAVYSHTLSKILLNSRNDSLSANSSLPSELFPLDTPDNVNLTYINSSNGYMVGPVGNNGSFHLSFTRALTKNNPDFENSNQTFEQSIVGYLTIVSRASSLVNITQTLNLEDGTRMSLVKLSGNYSRSQARLMDSLNYTVVLPTSICPSCYGHDFYLRPKSPSYSALVNGSWGTTRNIVLNNYGKVAIAYAPVNSISQVWGVLIFQAHGVMYKPIATLRTILLASVFAIGIGVCLVTFLLSGWVVKPITRLQAATEQSTNYYGKKNEYGPFWKYLKIFHRAPKCKEYSDETKIHRPFSSTGPEFRIPEQVVTRKYIKDELTELTETFNEMTAELRKQYTVLEERVVERTKEIKTAKVLAETANEAKSLFIANITHELRTPLNGILGMAAVSMEESDSQNIRDSLKVIFKSGELLLRLLTDLLSFSKSQVNNMQLEPKGFMVSEVTDQLHAIFDEQSRTSGIHFSIKVLSSFLEQVELMGDINRILQVVMNLVSNSMKFTPTDGKVSVQISASLVGEGHSADFPMLLEWERLSLTNISEKLYSVALNIAVQDTGPGIASHLQSRVFEPFVQGDLALSEKRGGVGLGLSICSQLANIMNGEISLKSELGQGSTFTFQVPLRIIQVLEPGVRMPRANDSLVTVNHQWNTELPSITNYTTGGIESFTPSDTQSLSMPHIDSKGSQLEKLSKTSFKDLSVLIAEDNRVNQEVLVKMLKLEGLSNVRVAKDGVEAVQAVKESLKKSFCFDIIFMDIQMPNLDGKQATEIIRNELNYRGTIIAVSAFTDHSNIDDCLAVGMDHFLGKPLRRPQLHSLLEGLQS